MRVIDVKNWPRREHFSLYSQMEFPHIGVCVQVNITNLWANRSRTGTTLTVALVYAVTKAANHVPELRQRIRGEQVIEHDVIHPLITVLGSDNIFGVTRLVYDPIFTAFVTTAEESIARAKDQTSLTEFPHDEEGEIKKDDLLSMTLIPKLAFTGFSLTRRPQVDSIPLLALGKVQQEREHNLLPVFANFHHALVDGVHISRFIELIEREAQELAHSFA